MANLPKPTNKSVPSDDIRDHIFAGGKLDEVITSRNPTYTDRLGSQHYTVEGIRQNVVPLSRQYMTLADAQADIANIPNGSSTYVRSQGGESIADEYINNGGVLEPTGRSFMSAEVVNKIINYLLTMDVEKSDDGLIYPVMADSDYRVVFGYNSETDRMTGVPLDDKLTQKNGEQASIEMYDNKSFYPVVTDRDYYSLLGFDAETDKFIASKISSKFDDSLRELSGMEYISDGTIYPVFADINGRVILGYDSSTDKLIGAIESAPTPVRAKPTPLPSNLRPAVKSVNGMFGYGQSLSIGAQGQPILSTTQPYSNLTFSSGPRGANHDYTASKPLVEDNLTAPDGQSNRGETFCSGAANYAGTLLATENGNDPNSHVIFAHTAGRGGTAISGLVKGSAWYNDNALAQVKGAAELFPDYAIHAVPWIQGETDLDNGTTYAVYHAGLEKLQRDIQSDIQGVTGQSSPVHFITYQCSYKSASSSAIALAQLDLCMSNDKFHLCTPTYHLPYYTDKTHLTNVGYKWLGAYIGRAYKRLVIDGVYPQFIKPVSAVLRGNVLRVKLDVPVLPLVIDKTTLGETADNGFCVTDNGNKVEIVSMYADYDSVIIKLKSVPSGITVVRYALDYSGAGVNAMNGASGNLRDSEPEYISISGVPRPLYNVCPHFQLTAIKVGE